MGVDSDLNKYLVETGKISASLIKQCKIMIDDHVPLRRNSTHTKKNSQKDLKIDDLGESISNNFRNS